MLDTEEFLEGTALIGMIGYALVSISSSLLIIGIELWVLWNFFDLLAWAEQFGIITLPVQAGIAVVALAGLGIMIPLVILTLMILVGIAGYLLE